MKNWYEYEGHLHKTIGKRKKVDDTIYTFDIETTSYLNLNGKQLSTDEYLNLNKEEKDQVKFHSCMYIWQFSVNDEVFFGRTWEELKRFLDRLFYFSGNDKKIVFVHNLSFEFQFLRNVFLFDDVFARKTRKVMKATIRDYNIEFRCSYYMTNLALEKLPDIYNLKVEKLVGNLDYNKIRHNKTKLSKEELKYCENDCLVVYEYIKKEIEKYGNVKNIPITKTGHVRRELKEKTSKNWDYKNKMTKSVNTDGHIYNLLTQSFQGGYTHANWIYTDKVLHNVTSYDFTSSYPYVMLTEKYPMSEFKKCNINKKEQMIEDFAYIIRVKFYNIKCKYYNNFISLSKCRNVKNVKIDNGRIITAEEIEITLTDIDFKFLINSYSIEKYEILESYFSVYDYLPKDFLEFILEKYVKKTEYKNIEEKKLEYNLEKSNFNSLYGMSVTNNIRDLVIFDNELGWYEKKLENEEILKSLITEKKKGFSSFSIGVWVTAYARRNLLECVCKLDKKCAYCDTDSLKLLEGFNIDVINSYNKKVIKKIKNVCNKMELNIKDFEPKDKFGISHRIGVFDLDGIYKDFITQGAKKYAVTRYVANNKIKSNMNVIKKGKEKSLILEITVAGVPKIGANALEKIEDFRDNFVFDYKYTNKKLLMYNDEMSNFLLTDYKGKTCEIHEKYGCCLVPTTYELGKSIDYANLVNDETSKRAYFKE